MGQAASKSVTKSAERVARKVADAAQPTGPPTVPPRTAPTNLTRTTVANNPAMFLRGEGVATQDIRDVGQEMYLQNRHKLDDKAKAEGPKDMPEDLLKFIQDVGPAKQQVDKEFTAPRLLEKENEPELQKIESARKVPRERIKMPLMGEDNNFTTTRNTNFSLSAQEDTVQHFGISNMQLYQLISKGEATSIDSFYSEIESKDNETTWTDEEISKHKKLLQQAREAIELPVLRQDPDGNIFGLYEKDVPGPEVKSVQPLPETKIKLVLKDLADRSEQDGGVAISNLERRRQLRKKGITT